LRALAFSLSWRLFALLLRLMAMAGLGRQSARARTSSGRLRMRVLMLRPPAVAAGPIPRLADWLADGFRRHGVAVTTMAWGTGTPTATLAFRASTWVRQVRNISRELGGGRYDAVVLHTAHDLKAVLRDYALVVPKVKRHSVPLALVFHGTVQAGLSQPRCLLSAVALLRRLGKHADVLFVLSRQEREEWLSLSAAPPVYVVKNAYVGFGTSVSSMSAATGGESAVSEDELRLLFVGRITKQKGILDLIAALAILRDRGWKCHLTVAGTGPDENIMRHCIRAKGVGDCCSLRGHVPHDRLPEVYAANDVFVLPTWREGFPTVLLEAMEFGLPCVVTPVGAIPDQLENGVHAAFVPAQDPASLADALARLAADPALRARLGAAARAKVTDYRPETVAETYVSALRTVCDDKSV